MPMRFFFLSRFKSAAAATLFLFQSLLSPACEQRQDSAPAHGWQGTVLAEIGGPNLTADLDEIWAPVLPHFLAMSEASQSEVFSAFHDAVLQASPVLRNAVKATIARLEHHPDQGWKHRLWMRFQQENLGGSIMPDSPASTANTDGEWIQMGVIENPRAAGELMRALQDIQSSMMALMWYLQAVIEQESQRSLEELQRGFSGEG